MPKQQQSYDSLVKILLIGDTGVGKTNILLRYFEDRFSLEHVATIGFFTFI
jgi:GTPase SAR1 family protein